MALNFEGDLVTKGGVTYLLVGIVQTVPNSLATTHARLSIGFIVLPKKCVSFTDARLGGLRRSDSSCSSWHEPPLWSLPPFNFSVALHQFLNTPSTSPHWLTTQS